MGLSLRIASLIILLSNLISFVSHFFFSYVKNVDFFYRKLIEKKTFLTLWLCFAQFLTPFSLFFWQICLYLSVIVFWYELHLFFQTIGFYANLLITFKHCILIRIARHFLDNLFFDGIVNTFQPFYFYTDWLSLFRQLVFDEFVNTFQPFYFYMDCTSPFRQLVLMDLLIPFNYFILILIVHHLLDNLFVTVLLIPFNHFILIQIAHHRVHLLIMDLLVFQLIIIICSTKVKFYFWYQNFK